MKELHYNHNTLYIEGLSIEVLAKQYGTPLYLYSQQALHDAYQNYTEAFSGRETLICYAVKANSNLSILQYFAQLGAGFDIVSGGELARVLLAGGEPQKIIFSGVGKTAEEMQMALNVGIGCFNVESENELYRLNQIAGAHHKIAPVSIRVNPDVDAKTHPYISTGLKDNKFGIPISQVKAIYQQASTLPNLKITGIDCHIGSQLLDSQPLVDALERLLILIDQLEQTGITFEHIDIGGGIGISYQDEPAPDLARYGQTVKKMLEGRPYKLILEPGRSLVGEAGVLLTKIEYLKQGEDKQFAIVDAGMNDLIRPSLYEAYHPILPVRLHPALSPKHYDIVGPICESSDFLGKNRLLAVREQDYLVVTHAGAYGLSMASNYNSRIIPAEILIKGEQARIIRTRQTLDQLLQNEKGLLQ